MVEDGRIGTPDLLAIPPPLLSSAGRRSGAAYAQPSARSECPSFQIFAICRIRAPSAQTISSECVQSYERQKSL
jgi:hypothetical protein